MKPDRHVHTAVCLVTEQAAFLPQVLAEHGSSGFRELRLADLYSAEMIWPGPGPWARPGP